MAIVAAVADNRVIGRQGRLPWHLPADLEHFARLTSGQCLIMGRRTFESLDEELTDRTLVVLSRTLRPDGVTVATSLAEALEVAGDHELLFVAGGAGVYEEALGFADRLYLTRVHASVEGDTLFPEIDLGGWELSSQRDRGADADNSYDLSFLVYCRRS